MRIYVESTIPSYLASRPARDLLQAARQQITMQWWNFHSKQHELFTSQIVLDEISAGEPAMARKRNELVVKIPILDLTDEAVELTEVILSSGLLPKTADRDAAHIALASVHQMDILLSWNCRHITNGAVQVGLRPPSRFFEIRAPVLCTPDEMIGDSYE